MKKKTIRLHECRKKYTYDQDKACSPEETVDRFLQRLKVAGLDILKEVKRIDSGRLDIPVYFSVCGKDALKVIGTKKQMGKGSTPEQSRASACMELAERFSFFSFLKDPDNFLVGDYVSMEAAGYPVLAIETLLQSVHDTTTNPAFLASLLHELPMRWTWATHLGSDEEILIPFSWFYAINEFNGPSAGNTYEEAILQGVSEVVERHVCALIARDRITPPAIDLDAVIDPVARQLIDKFTRCGIQLLAYDFSLDTGIPTVGALAWDPATFPEKSEIVYTAGTTPDANKALIRALTEVAQLAGDFSTGSNYVASGLPKPVALEDVDYILGAQTTLTLSEMADVHDPDMHREILNCVEALRRINLDVFVLDTMHPDLQIPAVYTIIPGAHFRERAAGGDAVLFAAKLAAELLDPQSLESHLLRLQEKLPDAYYIEFYRGQNLYAQGYVEDALRCFEQAMTKKPHVEDQPYIASFIGSCFRDLERYDEAIAALEIGLALDEERPDIHNVLGVCHYKKDNFSQAVLHFQRAVELNPVSAIDYANLALNLENIGRFDEAIYNYQIALSQNPSIEFAQQRLAGLMEQKA